MTLQELIQVCSANPTIILFCFTAIPLSAGLAMIFGNGQGHLSPWKYLYGFLVYASAIPGIFAITYNIYLFLFERRAIGEANILFQILPIISMMATLYLIRKNVSFDRIPGFDKISGLIMILTSLIAFMWFLEKTHIIAFTIIPFSYLVIGFIVLLVLIRFGWSRLYS